MASKGALLQNFSSEYEFDFHENEPVGETHFNEWFRTQPRFDTEAKGNSECAYSICLYCHKCRHHLLKPTKFTKKLNRFIIFLICTGGGSVAESRSDHLAGVVFRWTLVQLLGHACIQPTGLPPAAIFFYVHWKYLFPSV